MADRTLDLSIGTTFTGTRWRIDVAARMKTQEDVEKVIRALETFRPLLLENPTVFVCVDGNEF